MSARELDTGDRAAAGEAPAMTGDRTSRSREHVRRGILALLRANPSGLTLGGRNSKPNSTRTHVVAFDEQGHEVRVLCQAGTETRGPRLAALRYVPASAIFRAKGRSAK